MAIRPILRLAWRDLRQSPGHTLALFAVITIAVAAYTAIAGSAGAFIKGLDTQQRATLAADLSIEMSANPEPAQLAALDPDRSTLLTLTIAPIRSGQEPDPVSAVLKAVDPRRYPFYGDVVLDPAQSLARALRGRSAVLSPDLMKRLGVAPGATIEINGVPCRVTARLESEPDRFAGNFSSPVRALISRETLEATAVLREPGAVLHRVLVALPPGASARAAQARLEALFPRTGVFSLETLNPGTSHVVEIASRTLTLLAWMALALAPVGTAVASRLHVRSRLATMAALKSLGGTPRVVRLWLGSEMLLIAAAAVLAGALSGLLMQRLILHIAGLSAEPGGAPLGATLPIALLSSCAVGVWQTIRLSRLRPGALHQAGQTVSAPSRPPSRFRSRLPAALRHGLRKGPRSVLAALILIAALITAAISAETTIASELFRSLPFAGADLYLTGFPHAQLEGIRYLLDRRHAAPYTLINLAWLRVSADAGERVPPRLGSCRDDLTHAVLDRATARSLGVDRGSTIYAAGRAIRVGELHDVPLAERTWYAITVPCAVLQPGEIFHGGWFSAPPPDLDALTGDLRAHFPALGIATPDDLFQELRKFLHLAAALIRFLALITALGAAVLAIALTAAVARTRIREIAMFRALGATRRFLAVSLTCEFVALGAQAGLIGGLAGVVLMNAALTAVLERPVLDPRPATLALAVGAGAALSALTGWIAWAPVLRRRPLAVLRGE